MKPDPEPGNNRGSGSVTLDLSKEYRNASTI
nr:MAG TPA: hypothetical protein [Caudoviricetes sp.]